MANLSLDELKHLNFLIEDNEKLVNQINSKPGMTRVIILGSSGCGKSSILCALMQKELVVQIGKGKRVELAGYGVQSGCQKLNNGPLVEVDNKLNFAFCECSTEDQEYSMREIINSFVIDSILTHKNNQENKIKIVIVIAEAEFTACRGQNFVKILYFLDEMFPNNETLKKNVALVITKSDIEISETEYLETAQGGKSPPKIFYEWRDFLYHISIKFLHSQSQQGGMKVKNMNFLTMNDYFNF